MRAGRVDLAAKAAQLDRAARVGQAQVDHRCRTRTVAEHRGETGDELAQLMAAVRIVRVGRQPGQALHSAIGENRICGSVSKD